MRTNIVKHKKISVAAFVGITALLLSIALFFGGYSFSAKAVDITDGSIIDYTVTADISLTLDVNGKSTPSTSTERDREHALENNSAHLRTRRIPINALHDKGDSYRLSSSGVTELYNYSTSYFTVTAGESSDGAYSMVEIVAKKSTADLKRKPRFAMILQTRSGERIKIHAEVTVIADSPVELPSTGVQKTVYVGAALNDDRTSVDEDYADSKHAFPIELTNYSKVEIDLADYLVGRKLFTERPDNAKHEIDENATNVLKNGKEYLVFNDLSSFSLQTAGEGVPTINGDRWDVDYYETGAGAKNHSFVLTIDLTADSISNMDLTDGKIWGADGAFFELRLRLNFDDEHCLYVSLPVIFSPSSNPRILLQFNWDTALNAGSPYADIDHNNKENSTSGYRHQSFRKK